MGENKAQPGNVRGPCALTVGPKVDYLVDTLPVMNVCPDSEGSTDATGRVRECHEKGVNSKAADLLFHCVSAQQRNGQPSREVLVVLVGLHKNRGWRKRDRRRQWNRRWLFGVDCRKSGKTLIRCRESCPIPLGRLANPIRAFAGTNQNHCSQSPGGETWHVTSLYGGRGIMSA